MTSFITVLTTLALTLGAWTSSALATHVYTLEDSGCGGGPYADNAYFKIDDGQLKTSEVLDFETKDAYTICIRTTDTGDPALTYDKEFVITVNDTHDPDYTLEENGCNPAHRPYEDNAAFNIDGDKLRTSEVFAYNTKNTYTICVRTTDSGNATYDKEVTVTVNDTTAPTLTSFTRQSPATSPTDADTLVFRATFDEDVQNVDSTDFAVNGSTTATVTGVTAVTDSKVFDLTVSGGDLASFNGTVGINLAGGQNITDLNGHALAPGEPATDETYSVENGTDSDGDGVADTSDAFPDNAAASIDQDGDGYPDQWNASCDTACQEASGLTLDPSADVRAADVNTDGVVDLTDCVLSLQIVTGQAPSAATIDTGADVNIDGKIGREEAVYVLRKLSEESD